jgi:carboxylate-amine ligase
MPLEPFRSSAPFTLGVELELQLVSLGDLDLAEASPDLIDLLSREPFPGHVVPEITQGMVEISTTVHASHATLAEELRHIRDTLLHAGDRLNLGVCGGGTHPFQHWSHRRIFDKPRFREVSALYGYLARQFTVFGQHIHVGCANGDDALRLLHALSRYIPHFIALSASSPWSQGQDTQFDSARLNSVFAFPLSGRAPFVTSWQAFVETFFEPMERTGIVKSMKDFYWDIRPKPEYGTIELRVCDTPLTVEHAAALAGYLQALCAWLHEGGAPASSEDDYRVYTYNRFQACRFGLEGALIDPRSFNGIRLRDDIVATVQQLQPHAERLQCTRALQHVAFIATRRGNDAQWLRAQVAGEPAPRAMVAAALRALRTGA